MYWYIFNSVNLLVILILLISNRKNHKKLTLIESTVDNLQKKIIEELAYIITDIKAIKMRNLEDSYDLIERGKLNLDEISKCLNNFDLYANDLEKILCKAKNTHQKNEYFKYILKHPNVSESIIEEIADMVDLQGMESILTHSKATEAAKSKVIHRREAEVRKSAILSTSNKEKKDEPEYCEFCGGTGTVLGDFCTGCWGTGRVKK
mgnify:CR=1 FL=1